MLWMLGSQSSAISVVFSWTWLSCSSPMPPTSAHSATSSTKDMVNCVDRRQAPMFM